MAHIKIGEVRQAQGDLAVALTSYQASHDIFSGLAQADPGNTGWQHDLSVSREKIDRAAGAGDPAALTARVR